MVMTTGMIVPSWLLVWALKALQNSMILTPCCPRAGPTGGEGFACPAGICSFTIPITFLAIWILFSILFHLGKIQLHRGGTPKNAHQHPNLPLLGIDRFHQSIEIRERSIHYPDLVAL